MVYLVAAGEYYIIGLINEKLQVSNTLRLGIA